MICGLRIKRNGGDRSLPMVTPDGVIWPIGEVALLLSGALSAQNGASRQLEQLFLSFCPRLTLSCPISDLFPLLCFPAIFAKFCSFRQLFAT